MQCGIADQILEQKKDICENTSEIEIRPVA